MPHALLAPSSGSRWLTCLPSARLEATFPDKSSVEADEGTLAHDLGALLIKRKLRRITKKVYDKELKRIVDNDLYDSSMWDYAIMYSGYVIEKYNEVLMWCPGALLFIEVEISMRAYIPEGFGTGDAFIVADDTLIFIDLKYGKGVQVSAEENKQMMIYALGALDAYDLLFDIKKVSMTIYQPRMDNISTWTITVHDLKVWGEKILKPKALLAWEGKGEYVAGDHCQFCRAKAPCRANRDFQMEIAEHKFREAALLNDDEIMDILMRQSAFVRWANSVGAYALDAAINGKKWPGYKLVTGRSNRTYSDLEKIAETLLKAGHEEADIFIPKSLKGITEMEKQIGKSDFDALLTRFIIKPPGKPTLVSESDTRRQWSRAVEAAEIFKD